MELSTYLSRLPVDFDLSLTNTPKKRQPSLFVKLDFDK